MVVGGVWGGVGEEVAEFSESERQSEVRIREAALSGQWDVIETHSVAKEPCYMAKEACMAKEAAKDTAQAAATEAKETCSAATETCYVTKQMLNEGGGDGVMQETSAARTARCEVCVRIRPHTSAYVRILRVSQPVVANCTLRGVCPHTAIG